MSEEAADKVPAADTATTVAEEKEEKKEPTVVETATATSTETEEEKAEKPLEESPSGTAVQSTVVPSTSTGSLSNAPQTPASSSTASLSSSSSTLNLSAYVADSVRQFYEENGGDPLKGPMMRKREFGVVALCDVSGYSALTRALSTKGNVGAETLTKVLNPYFHFVIDILEKSGGDVIKFIGDAILVCWSKKDGTAETVASACLACLKLLERLGDHILELDLPGETSKFNLSMHIGLGVGEVFDVHVGTERYARWEFFLAGNALKEAVRLVDVAKKKELCITPQALGYLKQIAESKLFKQLGENLFDIDAEERNGVYILKSISKDGPEGIVKVNFQNSSREIGKPPPPKGVYKRYINESLLNRFLSEPSLAAKAEPNVNELRQVTIVFLKVGGLDTDSESVINTLQSIMSSVQHVLKSFEGTLRQMVIDDKGVNVLMVFGLPPWSHENDSIFGVRAALELSKLLKSLVPTFSMGVTSGTVFTGIIGGRTRRDHTVMGDTVNLAARLMGIEIAKDSVICDMATYNACKQDIEFNRKIPPIQLKGVKEHILVAKALDIKKRNDSTPSLSHHRRVGSEALDFGLDKLIGREKEIDSIRKAINNFVESGVPKVVVIEGDGGMGKSSFSEFTLGFAESRGIHTINVKGDEVEEWTAYYVYRDIVCDLLDIILANDVDLSKIPAEELNNFRGRSTTSLKQLRKQDNINTSNGNVNNPGSPPESENNSPSVETNNQGDIGPVATVRSRKMYGSRASMSTKMAKTFLNSSPNEKNNNSMKNSESSNSVNAAVPIANSLFVASNHSNSSFMSNSSISELASSAVANGPNGATGSNAADDLMKNHLQDQAKRALEKLGFDGKMSSLFRPMFPIMASGKDVNMNSDRAQELMADLLVDMINRLAKVGIKETETFGAIKKGPIKGILFQIDDAHWMDTFSWRLTMYLIEKCPHLFVSIGCRAIREETDSFRVPRSSFTVSKRNSHFLNKGRQSNRSRPSIHASVRDKSGHSNNNSNSNSNSGLNSGNMSRSSSNPQIDGAPRFSTSNSVEDVRALSTRPSLDVIAAQKDIFSPFNLYTRLQEANSTVFIRLHGLGRAGVEKLLVRKYYKLGTQQEVRSVQEKLLDDVMRKTGGNPLYVDNLASQLFAGKFVGVSPSLELYIKAKQITDAQLAELIPDDPQAALIASFDRLPREIQLVLRVASVIGQQFSLETVVTILPEKMTVDQGYATLTSAKGVDSFIEWVKKSDGNTTPTKERDDRSLDDYRHMRFKSIVVQKCIYSTILFEERQQLHHSVAQYYETLLAENTSKLQVLPLISFHYSHTKDRKKFISTLESTAMYYFESHCMTDAIQSFLQLFDLLGQNDSLPRNKSDSLMEKAKREQIPTSRLSVWQRTIGAAYVARHDWSAGLRHLRQALVLLNFTFPNTDVAEKLALVKQKNKQKKYWAQYMKLIKHDPDAISPPSDGSLTPERLNYLTNVTKTLIYLTDAFSFIGDEQKNHLSLYFRLNMCEEMGDVISNEHNMLYGKLLATYGYNLWLTNKKSLAKEYFERSLKISQGSKNLEDMISYHSYMAECYFTDGDFVNCYSSIHLAIRLCDEDDNDPMRNSVLLLRCIIDLYVGKMAECRTTAYEVFESANNIGDEATLVIAACLITLSLLVVPGDTIDGVSDIENWIPIIYNVMDDWSDALTTVPGMLIFTSLSLYTANKCFNEETIQNYESVVEYLERAIGKLAMGKYICIAAFFFILALGRWIDSDFVAEGVLKGNNEFSFEKNRNRCLHFLKTTQKALEPLVATSVIAVPILHFCEGTIYRVQKKNSKTLSSFKKSLITVPHQTKFLRAMLLCRLLKYYPTSPEHHRYIEATNLIKELGISSDFDLTASFNVGKDTMKSTASRASTIRSIGSEVSND